MGIFGKLDAANVPSNPFHVEKGEYSAEVTNAEYRKKKSDDTPQLFIEYTINDEDSQYCDSKVAQYFTLPDPELTHEKMSLLSAEEQRTMRRSLAALKRTLCGNDLNEKQRGLGVDPNELNDPDWTPEALIGTRVRLAVENNGPNKEYVNVKWVNLDQ